MRRSASAVLAVVVLALAALAGVLSRATPPARPPDAPAAEFSAGRAQAALAPVAASPRVAGTPEHARAREHLLRELRTMGLDATVVGGIGYAHLPGRTMRVTAAARVDSVLGTRPGTASTGTVVLATHYDTVAGSPGGADPGIGIATLLEMARVVMAEPAGRNDLAVLITDGEEAGLAGAQAFIRDHAARLRHPVVVVNHEARGGAGRPVTIRTAGDVVDVLARAPRPEVESALEALFALVPNNTDFSIFQEAGWLGVDTATVGDSWSYHTPADDLTRLDAGSLQLMGDTTLAVTRELLGTDLGQIDREREGLPTTLPWGLLTFEPWSVVPLAALSLALVLAAIGWRRAKGELTIPRTLAGVGLSVLAVLGAAIAATACWEAAKAADPGRASVVVGEPARPVPYLVAELLAVAAVYGLVMYLARRRPGASALAHGGLLVLSVLTLASALLLPAVVTWLLLPLCAVSIGLVASVPLRGLGRVAVITAGLALAAWMAGTQLSGVFDSGVGQGAPMIGGMAGLLVVLVGGPLYAATSSPRTPARDGRSRPPARSHARVRAAVAGMSVLAVAVAVPAVATAIAMALDTPRTAVRQERVGVRIDPARRTATWDTSGRTEWGGTQGERIAPADPTCFPAPRVTVISDRVSDGQRHVNLLLTSVRRAPVMELQVTGGRLAEVSVEGVKAPAPSGSTLHLSGLSGTPVEVSLTLADLSGSTALELSDHTTDITEAPGYTAPDPGVLLVGPDVSVSSTLDLPSRPATAP